MISCWKMVGLGLLVGGLAAASCTVSSDDDDNGAGGSPTTYTGGTGGTAGTGAAGGGTAAGTGGTAGTSPTAATDEACFNCLAQDCTDYGTCLGDAACEPQLSEFRLCAYQRQWGLQSDQNGAAQEYGQDQQDECLALIDQGEPNNLALGVHDAIGCADNEGLNCQATCFVFR
jgi:hypothetical protein